MSLEERQYISQFFSDPYIAGNLSLVIVVLVCGIGKGEIREKATGRTGNIVEKVVGFMSSTPSNILVGWKLVT
ncbi:hypothetical protein AKJ16_DCAP20194 [Drosera capensis]